MKAIMLEFARIILVGAIITGSGMAQEAASPKHVKDIRAEQTKDVISSSALCQRVRADGHAYNDILEVNPATLESDLSALMQKSDAVVLGGVYIDEIYAISPSGKDVAQYFDVKVLRAWKGPYVVGDLLTFAVPFGGVYCGLGRPHDDTSLVASTRIPIRDFKGIGGGGPYILFLRQSRGDETQLIPGLRLAGGDGFQGLYPVNQKYDKDCSGILPGSGPKCNAVLDVSQELVSVPYRLDPFNGRYDHITVSRFLKEIQSVADSLGYTAQARRAK